MRQTDGGGAPRGGGWSVRVFITFYQQYFTHEFQHVFFCWKTSVCHIVEETGGFWLIGLENVTRFAIALTCHFLPFLYCWLVILAFPHCVFSPLDVFVAEYQFTYFIIPVPPLQFIFTAPCCAALWLANGRQCWLLIGWKLPYSLQFWHSGSTLFPFYLLSYGTNNSQLSQCKQKLNLKLWSLLRRIMMRRKYQHELQSANHPNTILPSCYKYYQISSNNFLVSIIFSFARVPGCQGWYRTWCLIYLSWWMQNITDGGK